MKEIYKHEFSANVRVNKKLRIACTEIVDSISEALGEPPCFDETLLDPWRILVFYKMLRKNQTI